MPRSADALNMPFLYNNIMPFLYNNIYIILCIYIYTRSEDALNMPFLAKACTPAFFLSVVRRCLGK